MTGRARIARGSSRGHPSGGLRGAIVARHHRIAAGADGGDAHEQQRDLGRALHLKPHNVIDAALSTPAASEASPSQMAGAISPAAIRFDRSGMGMRAM